MAWHSEEDDSKFGIRMDLASKMMWVFFFFFFSRSHLPCYSIKPPPSFLEGSVFSKLLCKLWKSNFLSQCVRLCVPQNALYASLFPVVVFLIVTCPSLLIAHSAFVLLLFFVFVRFGYILNYRSDDITPTDWLYS